MGELKTEKEVITNKTAYHDGIRMSTKKQAHTHEDILNFHSYQYSFVALFASYMNDSSVHCRQSPRTPSSR